MPISKEELESLERNERKSNLKKINDLTKNDHDILIKIASDIEELKGLLKTCIIKMEGIK